jgi:hypothetical protein
MTGIKVIWKSVYGRMIEAGGKLKEKVQRKMTEIKVDGT